MKILFVITSLAMGGAETQLVRMAQYLSQDKKNKITVVVMIEPQDFVEELNQAGVDVISLRMQQGKASMSALFSFIKIIRSVKPDVVHAHMFHSNLICRIARIFVRIPVLVNTIHGVEGLLGRRSFIYRVTDPLCNVTTAVGNVLAEMAIANRAVPANKLRVIYNALDVHKYSFQAEERDNIRAELMLQKDQYVWISVGRLFEVKDHKTMLAAFRRVVSRSTDITPVLLLVGDGENRAMIEEMIASDDLLKNVRILGRRSDVNRILCAADAFVLSSVHEGLPLVLQEAASIGLPMVATDVGGCKEVIINDKNGYIVPPKAPEQLAEAMRDIMSLTADRRNEFSEFSKNLVNEKYEIHHVMKQWLELYQ